MSKNLSESNHTDRQPDCTTEVHVGNTTLIVYGYLKLDATETAEDKLLRVLKAEVENVGQPIQIA